MNQRSIVALTGLALAVYAAWLVYLGWCYRPSARTPCSVKRAGLKT